MTAVVVDDKRYAVVGDIKFIMIQTSAACDTGHTLDLGSDTFAGAEMNTVRHTIVHDDAGLIEEATFDPDTGIITMGTLTATGIHNITIIGF